MDRLRQTGIILVATLLLISTTGFTLYHHICACKPVVVKMETHSCCSSEGTGCANHHKGCKDVPTYYKASLVAVPVAFKALIPEVVAPLVAVIPFGERADALSETVPVVSPFESPPPLAGRQLVTYLHQIRIPVSA